MRILVQRTGAFGDVLLTTPILRRLKAEFPSVEIDVDTAHTNALINNPNVAGFGTRGGYDRIIDLNLAYESRPAMPQIDAMMEVAFGDRGDGWDKTIECSRLDWLPESEWARTVVLHPVRTWRNRTPPEELWRNVANLLTAHGFRVVATGTLQDQDISPAAIDIRGKYTTAEQAAIIGASACFVCFASGLLTLAGATEVPIVSLHTIGSWRTSATPRHGDIGWNHWPIETGLECRGCYDRRTAPITYMDCPLGHNACVTSFDPKQIADTALRAISRDERCR